MFDCSAYYSYENTVEVALCMFVYMQHDSGCGSHACMLIIACLCVCLGLSTYLPLRKEPPLISEANMKTPIFQAHGDMDYTVSAD